MKISARSQFEGLITALMPGPDARPGERRGHAGPGRRRQPGGSGHRRQHVLTRWFSRQSRLACAVQPGRAVVHRMCGQRCEQPGFAAPQAAPLLPVKRIAQPTGSRRQENRRRPARRCHLLAAFAVVAEGRVAFAEQRACAFAARVGGLAMLPAAPARPCHGDVAALDGNTQSGLCTRRGGSLLARRATPCTQAPIHVALSQGRVDRMAPLDRALTERNASQTAQALTNTLDAELARARAAPAAPERPSPRNRAGQ